jgi:hypothetical protein
VNLAAELLLIAVLRHYAWPLLPADLQGMGSKGLGAAAILVLLSVVWRLRPSRPLAAVLLWWAFEELQTLLCSAAWMLSPWEVLPGQAICSARTGFDFGAIGILAVAALAYRLIPVRPVSIETGPSS